jgi:sec-independent protein translocase protein TatA
VFGGIGVTEILLLLLLAALLFGTKKLPSIGRSAGKGMRELKDSAKSFKEPLDEMKALVPGEVAEIRKVTALANPRTALTKVILDGNEPNRAESSSETQTDK